MDVQENQLTSIEGDLLIDTFADFERAVLQDNITLFDTKAAAVLAFSGVMLLYCVDQLAKYAGASGSYVWIIVGLLSVAAAGFLVSAWFSLSTVRPRVLRSADDHVFWDSATFRLPIADYLAAMKRLDPKVARDDKLRHLHLLAGICRNKIRQFRTSLYVAQAAFLALLGAEVARVVL